MTRFLGPIILFSVGISISIIGSLTFADYYENPALYIQGGIIGGAMLWGIPSIIWIIVSIVKSKRTPKIETRGAV